MKNQDLFIRAIEGDASAAAELGGLYYCGNYGKENCDKAFALFMKAYENDSDSWEACAGLSDCFLNGIGTEKNFEKAVEWAVRAAARGDSETADKLAQSLYDEDKPLSKNTIKAFEIWLLAAYAGCAEALTKAALCYLCGIGTVRNKARGIELLEKAVDMDCANACYQMGHCLSEGNGVEKNKEKAFEYYRKASDLGCDDATFMLRLLAAKEEEKKEPEKTEEKTEIYSFSSRKEKEPETRDNLATGLEMLDSGNIPGAVFYLELAAEENSIEAKFRLGELYIGQDLASYTKAEKCFLDVIAGGESEFFEKARFNLATLYTTALKNDEKAFVMWKALADEGNVDAQYNCGLCYYNAIGTEKNADAAMYLWQAAASNGHQDAMYNLETVRERRRRKALSAM